MYEAAFGNYAKLKNPKLKTNLSDEELGRQILQKRPELADQYANEIRDKYAASRPKGESFLTRAYQSAGPLTEDVGIGAGLVSQGAQALSNVSASVGRGIRKQLVSPEQFQKEEIPSQYYQIAMNPYTPKQWQERFGTPTATAKTLGKDVFQIGSTLLGARMMPGVEKLPGLVRFGTRGLTSAGESAVQTALKPGGATPQEVLSSAIWGGIGGAVTPEITGGISRFLGSTAGAPNINKYIQEAEAGAIPATASKETVQEWLSRAGQKIKGKMTGLLPEEIQAKNVLSALDPTKIEYQQKFPLTGESQEIAKQLQKYRDVPLKEFEKTFGAPKTFNQVLSETNANIFEPEKVRIPSLGNKSFSDLEAERIRELAQAQAKQAGKLPLGANDTSMSLQEDVARLSKPLSFVGNLKEEAIRTAEENLANLKLPTNVADELRGIMFRAAGEGNMPKFIQNILDRIQPKGASARVSSEASRDLFQQLVNMASDPKKYKELSSLLGQTSRMTGAVEQGANLTLQDIAAARRNPVNILRLLPAELQLKLASGISPGTTRFGVPQYQVQQALGTILGRKFGEALAPSQYE